MIDLEDDFIKFHDETILENAQLRAKLEALEDFVKSSMLLLFETSNYNQLLKEYILNELNKFNDLSNRKEVYSVRTVANIRHDYLMNLRQQMEELK